MAGVQDTVGWRWAFYIQAVLLCPNILVILTVPDSYLDVHGTGKELREFRKEHRSVAEGDLKVVVIKAGMFVE